MDASRLLSYLRRDQYTDDSGRTVLATFPGRQSISARRGSVRSPEWRGTWNALVTLYLEPTFTVGGQLLLSGDAARQPGKHRITIRALEGNLWQDCASTSPTKPGQWGPLTIPRNNSFDLYRADFESSSFPPLGLTFPPPEPGSHQDLALEPQEPIELWFLASDEGGTPIGNSVVQLDWGDGCPLEALSREDGYVYVGNARAGHLTYGMWAPGFTWSTPSSILVPLNEPTTLVVTLTRSSTLRGTVLHHGDPVPSFQIVLWPFLTPTAAREYQFLNSRNGTFEIPDAPVGDLAVTASTPILPNCEPIRVTTSIGQATNVRLELPDSKVGKGIVVDAKTGVPVSEATLQLFVSTVATDVAPWGLPHRISNDGEFSTSGFAPGRNFYRISAPGYSSHYAAVQIGDEDVAYLGRIALFPAASIEIALTGNRAQGSSTDFSSFIIRADGPEDLPYRRFNRDGTARFEHASHGSYIFVITRPDGFLTYLDTTIDPGSDWRCAVRAFGDRSLQVVVLGEDGRPLEAPVSVEVYYEIDPDVLASQRHRTDDHGSVTFQGIEADAFDVVVRDLSLSNDLAAQAGRFDGHVEANCTVQLGMRAVQIIVRDEQGQPVDKVRVRIADPGDLKRMVVGWTNREGIAEIVGVPEQLQLAFLSHTVLGVCNGRQVDGREDQSELVFSTGATIELVVEDAGVPLVDVQSAMWEVWGNLYDRKATDLEGRVRYGPMAPDVYMLHLERTDCWPIDVEVEARREDPTTRVTMRRLGGVTLTLLSRESGPVGGRGVELQSMEYGESVRRWIESGRVIHARGLVSDAGGKVEVEGLPHGLYEWSVADDSGQTVRGTVRVLPGATVTAPIELP